MIVMGRRKAAGFDPTSLSKSRQPGTWETTESGVYPGDLLDVEQWHAWKATDDGRKIPRAPYEHPDRPEKFVSAQVIDPDLVTAFVTSDALCIEQIQIV